MTEAFAKAAGIAATLWMLTFPPAIFAQQAATVGELIDKGGKKLAREEVVKLVSGARVRGISSTNTFKFDATYKSDGTMAGLSLPVDGVGRGSQFSGTWSVSEQGEFCVDSNSSGGRFQSCTPYFALGGTYYQALKDEKSAPVYEREIKR